MDERAFISLAEFLKKIPGIDPSVSCGETEGLWWYKFSIDIKHKLAWRAVQELAHVVNYISLDERLPAVFYPVSPPPYLNGGPDEFLSWVIESRDPAFKPGTLKKWLEERLPKPVEDKKAWSL
jgi:hypothetical protein